MQPLNRKLLVIRNLKYILGLAVITGCTKNYNLGNNTELQVEKDEFTIASPLLLKDFIGFREALAFKESRGLYHIKNKYGYVGKYQFGKTTLKHFKIYSTKKFLTNPELQEKAFEALCKVNKWILRKEIKNYSGKKIKGIKVTESGILAAAHLLGAQNVKKFLKTKGSYKITDAFGTTISSYLKSFGGYDTSYIQADRNAAVS